MSIISHGSNIFRESPIYISTQNWTSYLLTPSVFWAMFNDLDMLSKYWQNEGFLTMWKMLYFDFYYSYWDVTEKRNRQFQSKVSSIDWYMTRFYLWWNMNEKIEIPWWPKITHFWGCQISKSARDRQEPGLRPYYFLIIVWHKVGYLRRYSNSKSEYPHVFWYLKIFDFLMERLLNNIKATTLHCYQFDFYRSSQGLIIIPCIHANNWLPRTRYKGKRTH